MEHTFVLQRCVYGNSFCEVALLKLYVNSISFPRENLEWFLDNLGRFLFIPAANDFSNPVQRTDRFISIKLMGKTRKKLDYCFFLSKLLIRLKSIVCWDSINCLIQFIYLNQTATNKTTKINFIRIDCGHQSNKSTKMLNSFGLPLELLNYLKWLKIYFSPLKAADINAVPPYLSTALTFTPFWMNSSTTLSCPKRGKCVALLKAHFV